MPRASSILAAFGVPIVNAKRIVHGKVEKLIHTGNGLFRNVRTETTVARYHSLVAESGSMPDCFEITATSEDGEIMAVEHKEYRLAGMQFHPESIGTKDGEKMLINFLHYRKDSVPVKAYIKKVLAGENLTFKEAYDIMDELTEGSMTDAQIGSLLTSLQIKNITSEELAGFASVLKQKAISFPMPPEGEKRIDTCGTGGSHFKTFNVSTIVSFVTAAAGAKVVKHGNRAVTSSSGSADLLEKLGVNVDMPVERCIDIYHKIGITFLYARKFHAAMRFAANARASLGFRTAFNLIGPLSNPAYATHQIIGVFDSSYTKIIAEALKILGTTRAMVVSGVESFDEISLTTDTVITELNNGWLKTFVFSPKDIGLPYYTQDELKGGNADINSSIAIDILTGKPSPRADLVAVNAGAALYLYDLATSIQDGFNKAQSILQQGKAKAILDELILYSNS